MKNKKKRDNNNNNGDNNNNFFNNNPLLVFVIFSIVTIFVFKALFPEGSSSSMGNSTMNSFGQTKNQTVAYSDLKKLISSGRIEYVGIGNTHRITSYNVCYTKLLRWVEGNGRHAQGLQTSYRFHHSPANCR